MIQLTAEEQLEYAKTNGITPNFRVDIGVGQKVWHTQDDWDAALSSQNITVSNGFIELTDIGDEGQIELAVFHCQDIGSYTGFKIDGVPDESEGGCHLEIRTSLDGITWSDSQPVNQTTLPISGVDAKPYTKCLLVLDADVSAPIITKLTIDYHFNLDLSEKIVALGDLTQSAVDSTLSEFLSSNMQISLSLNRSEISPIQRIINNQDYSLFVNVYAGFGTDEHLIFKGIVKDMSIKDGVKNTVIIMQIIDFTDALRKVICDDVIQEEALAPTTGVLNITVPALSTLTPAVSPGWVVNAYLGKTLAVTVSGAVEKFDIISNTAGAITFDSSAFGGFTGGATYPFEVREWPTAKSVMSLIKTLLYSQNIFDISLVQGVSEGVGNLKVCDITDGYWVVKRIFKINKDITFRLEKNTSHAWRLSSIKIGNDKENGDPIIVQNVALSEMAGYDGISLHFGCMMFDPEQYARESGINHVAFYMHYKLSGTQRFATLVFDIVSGLWIRKKIYTMIAGTGLPFTKAYYDDFTITSAKMCVTDITADKITFDVATCDNKLPIHPEIRASMLHLAITQDDSMTTLSFTAASARYISATHYTDMQYGSVCLNGYENIIFMEGASSYSPGLTIRFNCLSIADEIVNGRRNFYLTETYYHPEYGWFKFRKCAFEFLVTWNLHGESTYVYSVISTGSGILVLMKVDTTVAEYFMAIRVQQWGNGAYSIVYNSSASDGGLIAPLQADSRASYFYYLVPNVSKRSVRKMAVNSSMGSEVEEELFNTSTYDIDVSLPDDQPGEKKLFAIGVKTTELLSSEQTPTFFTPDTIQINEYRSGDFAIPDTSIWEGKTIWEVLTELANGFLFFIGISAGKFFFRTTLGGSFFTINDNNVMSISDAKLDREGIYNEVVIQHSTGTKTYTEDSSILKWGKKTKAIKAQFISEAYADALALSFFEKYAYAVYKVTAKVRYSPHVEIVDNGLFDFPWVAYGAFSNILELKQSLTGMTTTLKIRMTETIEFAYYGIAEYGLTEC